MLGHHWPASETQFKWGFAGGPMMARLCFLPSSTKKKTKKKRQSWTPLRKLPGSAHAFDINSTNEKYKFV